MALWKDVSSNIYDDANGAALFLASWPKNLVQITQAQADASLCVLGWEDNL
jgi:hypothetical protein